MAWQLAMAASSLADWRPPIRPLLPISSRTDVPALGEGEVLVRNLMLSCDPTQRGWIAFDTYLPAVKIGEVVRSIGAGRIVASDNADFSVGDIVSRLTGWRTMSR